MFADAIERNMKCTRSVHFITRNFGSTEVIPGTATMFFVNDEGVAITCKHVAKSLLQCKQINDIYSAYKNEISSLPEDSDYETQLNEITQKYGYTSETIAELRSLFFDCAKSEEDALNFTVINHNELDLSIIKINNAKSYLYKGHAVFAKDSSKLRRGDFLCRIGYPFPEFTNYEYNVTNDEITWTQKGKNATPLFPIEGMFTREVAIDSDTVAYELSTPGLKGQSGGPLFDKMGIVYGIQSVTCHLHLGFDQYDTKVRINGEIKEVENHPFLHVGRCICVDVIKKFLDDNNIKYYVDDGNGGEEIING